MWLLEAVYAIVEQELFPSFPDAVIYPVDSSRPEFIAHARCDVVIGDWRPGFLNAGAPLVFISTFKLLDTSKPPRVSIARATAAVLPNSSRVLYGPGSPDCRSHSDSH